MQSNKIISLCIPTNGVLHWVKPVLDSIYSQEIDISEFEVIVCDNGNNSDFEQSMFEYAKNHSNLIYKKSNAKDFLNVIESFKLANGTLIKFINHRTKLLPNALQYYLDFAQKYKDENEKPIIYFSNNVFKKGTVSEYNNFSDFVSALGIYSSWSTGMTIWKEDFDKISSNMVYNHYFPHTTILFNERNKLKYIIDDKLLLDEIPQGKTAKGGYDLFYYFCVEYPDLLLRLVQDGDFKIGQFLKLKKEIFEFCVNLGVDFFILKNYCSYDLSSFSTSIDVFFSKKKYIIFVVISFIKRVLKKIIKLILRVKR